MKCAKSHRPGNSIHVLSGARGSPIRTAPRGPVRTPGRTPPDGCRMNPISRAFRFRRNFFDQPQNAVFLGNSLSGYEGNEKDTACIHSTDIDLESLHGMFPDVGAQVGQYVGPEIGPSNPWSGRYLRRTSSSVARRTFLTLDHANHPYDPSIFQARPAWLSDVQPWCTAGAQHPLG